MEVAFTTVPVPTFRSVFSSVFGGAPTTTGTEGAPFGSGLDTATHGLPAAEGSGFTVVDVVAAVVAVVVVVGEADLLSPRTCSANPIPMIEREDDATGRDLPAPAPRAPHGLFRGGQPGLAVLCPLVAIPGAHGRRSYQPGWSSRPASQRARPSARADRYSRRICIFSASMEPSACTASTL